MDRSDLKTQVLFDFAPFSSTVLGIYLYGSQVEGRADERSDIDICIVAGAGKDPTTLQYQVWRQVKEKRYDIRIFELLPLHLQIQIISRGILLQSPDPGGLGEYLYPYWKRWDDQRWYQTPIQGAP